MLTICSKCVSAFCDEICYKFSYSKDFEDLSIGRTALDVLGLEENCSLVSKSGFQDARSFTDKVVVSFNVESIVSFFTFDDFITSIGYIF